MVYVILDAILISVLWWRIDDSSYFDRAYALKIGTILIVSMLIVIRISFVTHDLIDQSQDIAKIENLHIEFEGFERKEKVSNGDKTIKLWLRWELNCSYSRVDAREHRWWPNPYLWKAPERKY
ncbi:hypothetical protein ACFLY7_01625 [Patescibacteria group bacterium]